MRVTDGLCSCNVCVKKQQQVYKDSFSACEYLTSREDLGTVDIPFPCEHTRSGAGPPATHPSLWSCSGEKQLQQHYVGLWSMNPTHAGNTAGLTIWDFSQLSSLALHAARPALAAGRQPGQICPCFWAQSHMRTDTPLGYWHRLAFIDKLVAVS